MLPTIGTIPRKVPCGLDALAAGKFPKYWAHHPRRPTRTAFPGHLHSPQAASAMGKISAGRSLQTVRRLADDPVSIPRIDNFRSSGLSEAARASSKLTMVFS